MEENKQEESLSLRERAIREYQERRESALKDKYFALPKEQRALAEKKDQLSMEMEQAFGDYFQKVIDDNKHVISLFAVPTMLVSDQFFGTNTTMRLLAGKNDISSDDHDYIMLGISLAETRIPFGVLSNRLITAKSGKGISLAECFWLFKLCKWLGCEEPEHFGRMLTEHMELALQAPQPRVSLPMSEEIKTKNIDFSEAQPGPRNRGSFGLRGPSGRTQEDLLAPLLEQQWRYNSLIGAAINQYEFLEKHLNRVR